MHAALGFNLVVFCTSSFHFRPALLLSLVASPRPPFPPFPENTHPQPLARFYTLHSGLQGSGFCLRTHGLRHQLHLLRLLGWLCQSHSLDLSHLRHSSVACLVIAAQVTVSRVRG